MLLIYHTCFTGSYHDAAKEFGPLSILNWLYIFLLFFSPHVITSRYCTISENRTLLKSYFGITCNFVDLQLLFHPGLEISTTKVNENDLPFINLYRWQNTDLYITRTWKVKTLRKINAVHSSNYNLFYERKTF